MPLCEGLTQEKKAHETNYYRLLAGPIIVKEPAVLKEMYYTWDSNSIFLLIV